MYIAVTLDLSKPFRGQAVVVTCFQFSACYAVKLRIAFQCSAIRAVRAISEQKHELVLLLYRHLVPSQDTVKAI